jgi:ribosome-associated heat shock protein Hsp15
MQSADTVRLDKWLWAVRIFKTRSLAAEACRGHKVSIMNQNAKPARDLRIGEVVQVRKDGILRSYKVLGLIEQRVGAGLVANFAEDLTSPAELELLKERKTAPGPVFAKGWGRPEKKDRRMLERLVGTDLSPLTEPTEEN